MNRTYTTISNFKEVLFPIWGMLFALMMMVWSINDTLKEIRDSLQVIAKAQDKAVSPSPVSFPSSISGTRS